MKRGREVWCEVSRSEMGIRLIHRYRPSKPMSLDAWLDEMRRSGRLEALASEIDMGAADFRAQIKHTSPHRSGAVSVADVSSAEYWNFWRDYYKITGDEWDTNVSIDTHKKQYWVLMAGTDSKIADGSTPSKRKGKLDKKLQKETAKMKVKEGIKKDDTMKEHDAEHKSEHDAESASTRDSSDSEQEEQEEPEKQEEQEEPEEYETTDDRRKSTNDAFAITADGIRCEYRGFTTGCFRDLLIPKSKWDSGEIEVYLPSVRGDKLSVQVDSELKVTIRSGTKQVSVDSPAGVIPKRVAHQTIEILPGRDPILRRITIHYEPRVVLEIQNLDEAAKSGVTERET